MKKYIYMAVAAIAALSSCSSDNDLLSGEQALTFTASMEGSATRATYNDTEKCASWETGDKISINGKTYNAQSAGLTTTFKAVTEGEEAEGPTYNAYFACTYDGSTATLPAEVSETWADGKFNMPMYATSEDTNLEFKNLCGVLKITVKSDEIAAVKKIKVSSATKAISGAFTVTNNAAVLSDASTVANTLTVTYSKAVTTDETGKVFYVAVPAQTYQELKIELDADGSGFTKSMTTKSATDITVARNKIYPITFADNAAPATTGSAAVKGGGTVNWVQLWAGGPKFAEKNIGATNVTDKGTVLNFSQATAEGDDYAWGSLWCTPSQDDMDELLKATSTGSENVTCAIVRQDNNIIGFRFTGKGDYDSNSVFFPVQNSPISTTYGFANYWSTIANGSQAWCMHLLYNSSGWDSEWYSSGQGNGNLVRPVLKN